MGRYTNIINSGCSFMAYPWEWDSYKRSSYKPNKDPGQNRQYLAKTYTFSSLLSKKLYIPELNLAYPGNSNTNAIRRVTDCVLGNNLEKSIVFLGLTQLMRHDIPTLRSKEYANLKITTASANKDIPTLSEVTAEEIEQYTRLWYKLNYNEEIILRELLMSLDLLNGIIVNRGGKLVVWDNLLETPLREDRDYFFKLESKIFKWPQFISKRDSKYIFGQHPNSEDHKELSQILIDTYIN